DPGHFQSLATGSFLTSRLVDLGPQLSRQECTRPAKMPAARRRLDAEALRWGKQAGFRAALAVQEVFAVPDAGSPP
ncbi:MAG: hypothetical protein ABWZ88_22260, partial [Variovorax sp.]